MRRIIGDGRGLKTLTAVGLACRGDRDDRLLPVFGRDRVMNDNVDISEQLRDQRKEYVKLQDRALLIAQRYPEGDLRKAMQEQCKILEMAIASVDMALGIAGGTSTPGAGS
jgi:hypothetical protein